MIFQRTTDPSFPRKNMMTFPYRINNVRGFRIITVTILLVCIVLLLLRSFADVSVSDMLYFIPGSSWIGVHSKAKAYGVMFDAGSTGTRIHVFTLDKLSGGELELSDEYFEEVKPGLSAYADDPKQGALSVSKLLEKSKDIVPEDRWGTTPVALKATAGLRLLPPASSEQLLSEVHNILNASPFLLPGRESVDIMDGLDEGLFAWLSVNFLSGGLKGSNSQLFGTLDLGGGSTQITLNPVDLKTLEDAPEGFLRTITTNHQQFKLYTHSYLGLGLMAARSTILGMAEVEKGSEGEDVRNSPCLYASYRGNWAFGERTLEIGGHSSYGFDACMEHARKAVTGVHKPAEIDSIQMFAFSYYFDRAVEMGLIDEEKGGIVTVDDYKTGAKKVCSIEPPSSFLCLDASYIVALLQDGFGFSDDRKLFIQKRIHGVEISWALGATLDLFDKLD